MLRFDGWICGVAFASDDRFVVGRWTASPFGVFADVMWRTAAGPRVLLAPSGDAARFVAEHYAFDQVHPTDVQARQDAARYVVRAGDFALDLRLGRRSWLSALLRARPRALRGSVVEDVFLRPLAGPLLGGSSRVRIRGRTRAGRAQRYVVHDAIPVLDATASVAGTDLGSVVAFEPAGFGFSEPPARPMLVRVTTLIEA